MKALRSYLKTAQSQYYLGYLPHQFRFHRLMCIYLNLSHIESCNQQIFQ